MHMGTDELFQKRKGIRKKRKESIKRVSPYRYLILCEGKKTEPNYFRGIKRKIEEKFKNKVDVKDIPLTIDIEGTGRNTGSLVDFALRTSSLAEIPYGHVWVVFDRDDFTDEQFNNSIIKASDNGLKIAWSNESIELWFLLHFEYLNSAINRNQYIEKLSNYFIKYNVNRGKYEKNLEEIYDILYEIGDINFAISNSKKLCETYSENFTDASKNPCTTVYLLVEELLSYLD